VNAKILRQEKSVGLLEDIAKEFALAKENAKTDSDSQYDRHHLIPQSLTKQIQTKMNRGEFDPNEYKLLKSVDWEMTNRVLKLCHGNYNEVLRGNAVPTQVLRRLNHDFLNRNCRYSSLDGERKALKFLYYVADHSGIKIDVERISAEVGKKDYVNPLEMTFYFGIDETDIMKYLVDHFLYPEYEQYQELWELLENMMRVIPSHTLIGVGAEANGMSF
jgi:hypothetical protein